MIHQFPQGLPDESLLSLCVRYHAYAQYCSVGHTLHELFEHPQSFPAPDLPGRLGHLASELLAPRNSTDWLMTQYTLFPFYAPFQPAASLEGMKRAMIVGSSSAMYKHIGMVRYYRLQPETLRFCPTCREDEERHYGFAYWHRLHQVPGVLVCPTHKVFLTASRVLYGGSFRRQSFQSLDATVHRGTAISLDSNNHTDQLLLDIAENAAWLLSDCHPSVNILMLRRQYWEGLKVRGLIVKGRVNYADLEQRFTNYCSPSLLLKLRCEVTAGGAEGWLAELLNFKSHGKHPLEHLLMMHFLGLQPQLLLGKESSAVRGGSAHLSC